MRQVLFAAVALCLSSIMLAIVAGLEHKAGRRPTWLLMMSTVLCVAGLAVGAVYFFAM